MVDITFPQDLIKQQDYVVGMDFIGVFNDQMSGLYHSMHIQHFWKHKDDGHDTVQSY
jgi:hypothetical protein